ncbi:MAG: squalene/phytoene synthase family protein, partial [Planctomycetes bacterium]|nr:squalene/phytoene synthase family protein [Planctomycetota bacterium]
DDTAKSYALCRKLARRSASSFYFSFRMLSKQQRQSMCALYAFLRRTDDIGDGDAPLEEKRMALAAWRESLQRALRYEFDDDILPALADTVTRYQIPHEYLLEVIDGVEMDLGECRYETFADLEQYCYRVATVVGLCCMHVWGFHGEGAHRPAHACGLAFQLTNILRDLKEDALRGRVYLPREDLDKFGCSAEDLRHGVFHERFKELMRFEIHRVEQFYESAAELQAWLESGGRKMLGAMMATYRALLAEIERRDGDVFSRPVTLSRWRKASIAARWMLLPPRLRLSDRSESDSLGGDVASDVADDASAPFAP